MIFLDRVQNVQIHAVRAILIIMISVRSGYGQMISPHLAMLYSQLRSAICGRCDSRIRSRQSSNEASEQTDGEEEENTTPDVLGGVDKDAARVEISTLARLQVLSQQ